MIYERAKFNQRRQTTDEPVETFITALYSLAEHCEFGTLREELNSRPPGGRVAGCQIIGSVADGLRFDSFDGNNKISSERSCVAGTRLLFEMNYP